MAGGTSSVADNGRGRLGVHAGDHGRRSSTPATACRSTGSRASSSGPTSAPATSTGCRAARTPRCPRRRSASRATSRSTSASPAWLCKAGPPTTRRAASRHEVGWRLHAGLLARPQRAASACSPRIAGRQGPSSASASTSTPSTGPATTRWRPSWRSSRCSSARPPGPPTAPALAAAFQIDINSGTPGDVSAARAPTRLRHRRQHEARLPTCSRPTGVLLDRVAAARTAPQHRLAAQGARRRGVPGHPGAPGHELEQGQRARRQRQARSTPTSRSPSRTSGSTPGCSSTKVLGPIVKEIKKVTGPLQPVIDTLYAPIPVLSDLSQLAGGRPSPW